MCVCVCVHAYMLVCVCVCVCVYVCVYYYYLFPVPVDVGLAVGLSFAAFVLFIILPLVLFAVLCRYLGICTRATPVSSGGGQWTHLPTNDSLSAPQAAVISTTAATNVNFQVRGCIFCGQTIIDAL